jgi:pimeloyl-ACP methyl ester carboxylesterase
MKQSVPRFATSDKETQAAYDAYVQKQCPCVIIVHSQGGNFGFNAALHAPDKVKAIIAVEPSGAPPATTNVAALKGVPHLFIWGDHLNEYPLWPRFQAAVAAYRDTLAEAGVPTEWVVLPERGIRQPTPYRLNQASIRCHPSSAAALL